MGNNIYITQEDMQRLRSLVNALQSTPKAELVSVLEEELDRAHVVESKDLPPDVVSLNSQVRVSDLDSGKTMEYELIYPNSKPSSNAHALSVLAPLGMALLGCRAGDVIELEVPKGKRRLKVIEVLYQPEAANQSAA